MISIRINDDNSIHVSHEIYRGRAVMNVRKYFRTDHGPWKATSKGITFGVERTQAVIDAMAAELACKPTPEPAPSNARGGGLKHG